MLAHLKAALKAKLSPIEYMLYIKWILKYALKGRWQFGTEMGHWAVSVRRYRRQDPTWVQPMPQNLLDNIKMLNETFKEKIHILEIGSGPLSRLTKGWKEGLYDLTSVDPLATEYKKNFMDFEYLVEGYGETVHEMFEPETFHMAFASNCLDHSLNPKKCFDNLYSMVKPKGLIRIDSNIREGTRAQWSGLHQFDIWVEEEDLICKTKKGDPYYLLDDKILVEIVEYHDRSSLEAIPWFTITYRKL